MLGGWFGLDLGGMRIYEQVGTQMNEEGWVGTQFNRRWLDWDTYGCWEFETCIFWDADVRQIADCGSHESQFFIVWDTGDVEISWLGHKKRKRNEVGWMYS